MYAECEVIEIMIHLCMIIIDTKISCIINNNKREDCKMEYTLKDTIESKQITGTANSGGLFPLNITLRFLELILSSPPPLAKSRMKL